MSDAPLTEKRFIELLELRLQPIEKRFETIEKDITLIKKQVSDLKGFQDHESNAIEFELRFVLEKYLRKMHPLFTVDTFPMKEMKDPYTHERMTDFDAAYLLKPYKKQKNNDMTARLRNHSMQYTRKNNNIDSGYIFVLAEAKHYIDSDKIKRKLWQFDKFYQLFLLANRIHHTEGTKNHTTFDVHPKFLSTVKYNPILAHIRNYHLFFGAAYWEKNLLVRFKYDVKQRRLFYNDFVHATSNDEKIKAYHKIVNIEKKWYHVDHMPNRINLSDTEIIELEQLKGAMAYVDFIQTSGDRYHVVTTNEPVGITSIPMM